MYTILYYSGYGCVSIGTVVHEMLHAAGFWHEQSRPDRDQHVSILWENISPGREDNFARYSRAEVSTLSLPYDTQRWSTCPLVFDCWLLSHVIYLKLRKK